MHDKTPLPNASSDTEAKPGKPSGFRRLVGYHAAVWRENYAEIELDLGPEHGNSIGIVHGGALMTILDAAMGHAATWTPIKGNARSCVTLSMTTNFLEGVSSGRIRAIGRVVSNENRIATCESEIRSETGTLMATAQGSFRYLPGSEKLEGVPKRQRT